MPVIEIIYALPEKTLKKYHTVASGTRVHTLLSEIRPFLIELAESIVLDLENLHVGIYGTVIAHDMPLEVDTRLEIYRPLEMDPKTRRRLRHEAKQKSIPAKRKKFKQSLSS